MVFVIHLEQAVKNFEMESCFLCVIITLTRSRLFVFLSMYSSSSGDMLQSLTGASCTNTHQSKIHKITEMPARSFEDVLCVPEVDMEDMDK